MDPRLTKQFVSPLISKTRIPATQAPVSRSFASPYAGTTPSFKRKLEDYVSDSGGEEDDAEVGLDGTQAVGMEDDPLVRVVHKTHHGETTPSHSKRPTNLAAQKSSADESYWMVQWRKPQQKKHKTWDGDGILIVRGARCILKDTDGKDIASAALKDPNLSAGDELRVAGKEIEIDRSIPAREFLDGTCFGYSTLPTVQPSSTSATMQPYRPLKPTMRQPVPAASFFNTPAHSKSDSPAPKRPMSGIGLSVGKKADPSEPRYNPNTPGAIVMKRPSKSHAAKFNKRNLPIVDVVVDPVLGALLRPHQREGVKFMYECVMGMKRVEATGCILADEMGLGKTLQTITLVHTLLQQNPYGGPSIGGVAGKVLIVTPVSLVQNWKKEFHKWLGKNRIGVFVGDKEKNDIKHFAMSKSHQVLLIGYEKLRTVIDVIKTCSPPIGLVICDEGHRLKSKDNKTTKMFDQLSSRRRIILSGTPLQNDLGEFWAMSDFACPGLLDTYPTFVKLYEKPILKSRAPHCTPKDQEIGKARMAKLAEITAQYVLRRTADIIADVLPPKHEYVVFIAPTSLQLSMFAKLLHSKALQAFIRGPTAQCLGLINHLKQICNYPPLLLRKEDNSANTSIADINAAVQLLPQNQIGLSPELSGKMLVLENFLKALFRDTEEKIVLVSNYTSTLDVLEKLCRHKRYKYLRLDGSTAQKSRQEYVDKFNRSDKHQAFVFLLSAKAGGVGLNLIGGSRLVLFDSDWNPSTGT
jgi:DNA repair and recombination protein RAD54B